MVRFSVTVPGQAFPRPFLYSLCSKINIAHRPNFRGRLGPPDACVDGTRNRQVSMKKQNLFIASMATAAMTSVLTAGISESVDVTFTLEFQSDTLGLVTIQDTFTATQVDVAGVLTLDFGGSGTASVEEPGYVFEYSNLDTLLSGDEISGGGDALLESFAGDEAFTFLFDGFGSTWDGTFSSGVGVIEFTPVTGFTVDTHEILWSVETVPAPGALAVLGLAGLARRRRRA